MLSLPLLSSLFLFLFLFYSEHRLAAFGQAGGQRRTGGKASLSVSSAPSHWQWCPSDRALCHHCRRCAAVPTVRCSCVQWPSDRLVLAQAPSIALVRRWCKALFYSFVHFTCALSLFLAHLGTSVLSLAVCVLDQPQRKVSRNQLIEMQFAVMPHLTAPSRAHRGTYKIGYCSRKSCCKKSTSKENDTMVVT